jgi:predicted HD superfamily hydrolase involved in NAD metabolism
MSYVPEPLRRRVLTWLEDQVPRSRLEHILRVEQMAIDLAQRHQADVAKAAQAGLMHDLAKCFKPEQLLNWAKSAELELDDIYRDSPPLLHADVGAVVAQREFDVQDEQILSAIANHTLGAPGMDKLSCVVYLADTLEPGRGDAEPLPHLRQVADENLAAAVYLTCDYTIQKLMRKERLIHPRAVLARNHFLQVHRNKPSQLAVNQLASA